MRALRRLGLFALALVTAAAVAEIALNAVDWRPARAFFVVDSRIGRRLLPDLDVRAWGGRVLSDRRGLRISGKAARPGAKRVLFLGGSSTFGYGLDWSDTYAARFAEAMARSGIAIDAINAGVPLGDSANRRAFLALHGDELKPDLVVFSEAINDLGGIQSGAHQCWVDDRLLLHVTWPTEEWWPIVEPAPAELESVVPRWRLRAWTDRQLKHLGWAVFANLRPALVSFARSRQPFAWLYHQDPERYQARLALDREHSRHGLAAYRDNLHAIAAWGKGRRVPIVFLQQPRQAQQDLYQLLPAAARMQVKAAITAFQEGSHGTARSSLAALVERYPYYVTPRYDLAVASFAADRAPAAQIHVDTIGQIHTYAHNLLMARVGHDEGVTVVHTELTLQSRRGDDTFLWDGIHPSAEGNDIIGGELARAVLESQILGAPGPPP